MSRNILASVAGIVSIVGLVVILGSVVEYSFRTFNFFIHVPFLHEINGPMSLSSWGAYLLAGIIVGLIAKKSHVLYAMLAGTITWILYVLLELPDWAYYFGYAKHPVSLAAMGIPYYLELGVAVIVLLGIGGFIGGVMQKTVSQFKIQASPRLVRKER